MVLPKTMSLRYAITSESGIVCIFRVPLHKLAHVCWEITWYPPSPSSISTWRSPSRTGSPSQHSSASHVVHFSSQFTVSYCGYLHLRFLLSLQCWGRVKPLELHPTPGDAHLVQVSPRSNHRRFISCISCPSSPSRTAGTCMWDGCPCNTRNRPDLDRKRRGYR